MNFRGLMKIAMVVGELDKRILTGIAKDDFDGDIDKVRKIIAKSFIDLIGVNVEKEEDEKSEDADIAGLLEKLFK